MTKEIVKDLAQPTSNVIGAVVQEVMVGKKWYVSKTVWVNVVAAIFISIQYKVGFILPADLQALALSAINVGLRKITKEEVIW